MRRTYRTLNDYEMQHNAEVGLFTKPSYFLLQSHGIARTFHNADAAPLTVIKIDLPPRVFENHCDFRTEEPTVVTLIADPAVEAAPSFFHGLADGDSPFDFRKRLHTFVL